LRPWNHSGQIGVFPAIGFRWCAALRSAANTPLLFVQLFLPTRLFPLAFVQLATFPALASIAGHSYDLEPADAPACSAISALASVENE